MTQESECTGKPAPGAVFTTTHWSVVLQAAQSSSRPENPALGQLCETYWYPLYAYVRRKGYAPDDAKDLTQEFFGRFLAGDYLRTIDRNKGKFRSFLLAAMEHFLAKQWRDARRLKRGGGQALLSLDDVEAEARYTIEPMQDESPQRIFERRWAFTVIEQALARLRDEFAESAKLRHFETLQPFLTGDGQGVSYMAAASQLSMTVGAAKVAVHRLRARYGELVRAEVAKTVGDVGEVDHELRHLLDVIGE